MRLIFMGTPDFAVSTLKALIAAGYEIVCVYSQPPKPAGRGMVLTPTPVHRFAEAQGIEVRTPASLKSPEEQERFAALNADAAMVVAYGLLLPKPILDAPKFGCFNVHASLLPRWRGAAPIQRAIMAGDSHSGVAIMRMEIGLDTGPVMQMERVAIKPETTAATLHDELAVLGARMMVEVLQNPSAAGIPQPSDGVTYAKKIDKAEARIDFSKTALEVRNHIHGLSPFPGAWAMMNGARVKILSARLGAEAPSFACADGPIHFEKLQREGKGVMDAATFLRGFPNPVLS
jgi:methionyl-tRNA formyltransferase